MEFTRKTNLVSVLAAYIFLAGCAGNDAKTADPVAERQRQCSFDETYSCIERMGEAVRCFCADKDTLRELLEPTVD